MCAVEHNASDDNASDLLSILYIAPMPRKKNSFIIMISFHLF